MVGAFIRTGGRYTAPIATGISTVVSTPSGPTTRAGSKRHLAAASSTICVYGGVPRRTIGRVSTPVRSTVASISTSPPPAIVGAGRAANSALRRRGGVNSVPERTPQSLTPRISVAKATRRSIIGCFRAAPLFRRQRVKAGGSLAGNDASAALLTSSSFIERRGQDAHSPGTSSSRAATCIPCRQAPCLRQSGQTRACPSRARANARNPDDPRHFPAARCMVRLLGCCGIRIFEARPGPIG